MCANPTTDFTNTVTLASDLLDGCFDERTLRPLPRYVLDALPLTDEEKERSEVFVLSGDYHDEDTPAAQCVSRLAICRPIPAIEWSHLKTGATIIYTEIYKFSEDERPGTSHIPALASNIGRVMVNDYRRRVLYTEVWQGNQNQEYDHEYAEVYEVWQVQRFVALAYAR